MLNNKLVKIIQWLISLIPVRSRKNIVNKPVTIPKTNKEVVHNNPLILGTSEIARVRSLQTDLKRLGFYSGKIDGDFGRGTYRSLQAAQYEMKIFPTGILDNYTAEAIRELLRLAERWKLPRKSDPEVEVPEDQTILYKSIMKENGIPPYFAEALAEQESGNSHFDSDGFVKMRCEFWSQYHSNVHPDYEIRYRSYGLMQILDMGHPEDNYTRGVEVGNITNKELRVSVAKNILAGAHLLRSLLTGDVCAYNNERRYKCRECIKSVATVERDWTNTMYHKWRSSEVPSYHLIPCGWATAIRKYNGSGIEAEAYRDEILTRITGAIRHYIPS